MASYQDLHPLATSKVYFVDVHWYLLRFQLTAAAVAGVIALTESVFGSGTVTRHGNTGWDRISAAIYTR